MSVRWKVKRFFKKLQGLKGLIGVSLLVVGLVIGLDLGQKVTQFFSEATAKKAEIVVQVDKNLGRLPRPWEYLGQGGEETGGMIGKTITQIKPLKPKYIRIDHIYDFYQVAQRTDQGLQIDFSRLDLEVEAILQTGAKPFLALSYMPPGLAVDIISPPYDWGDWQQLVKATIEHYSGKQNKNIQDVYYEVWNEPDLFGSYKMGGERSYLEMYRRASWAAEAAANAQPFKLGGPATTGMYTGWLENLYKASRDEGLRLDFVSWHRYSLDLKDFKNDVEWFSNLSNRYPELALKERVLSEWGPDPENNPAYDNQIGAAHMMAVMQEIMGGIHKAFVFEIMDGKDPQGKNFWGRYGLISHESSGLISKPRYLMIEWLNQLGETRLALNGEGSFVKGIAASNNNNKEVQIYLVNYDKYNSHWETVPVTVKNLKPGNYQVIKQKLNDSQQISPLTITSGTYVTSEILKPNEVLRIIIKSI